MTVLIFPKSLCDNTAVNAEFELNCILANAYLQNAAGICSKGFFVNCASGKIRQPSGIDPQNALDWNESRF